MIKGKKLSTHVAYAWKVAIVGLSIPKWLHSYTEKGKESQASPAPLTDVYSKK